MLWLPVSCTSSGCQAIAVSDASVVALECALLEPQAAYEHLLAALLVDPWFCRWAVAERAAGDTLSQLADQFASELAVKLAALPSVAQAWTRVEVGAANSLARQAAAFRQQAMRVTPHGEDAAHSLAFCSQMLEGGITETETEPVADYQAEVPGVEWRVPRLVARLARCQAIESHFQIELEQAKLDAMKELAYGASHEVNNPLANISGRAQTMLRDQHDPRTRRLLTAIDAQALRAHEMISDLMLFARPPQLVLADFDVGELLSQVARQMQDTVDEQTIKVRIEPPIEPIRAQVDATQLKVAVAALVQNGIDAAGGSGTVTLSVIEQQTSLVVRVVDTGAGIEPEVRRHMFDPFYSGREAGRGLGFGLSKCWRIAQQHGGSVVVEKTSGEGTIMAIRLPLNSLEA